jgi:DNA-binding beta-propeller fold protein YncE
VVVASQSSGMQQVVVFDYLTGEFVRGFGAAGSDPGGLKGTSGVRITRDGRHVVVAEANNHRISIFTLTGEFCKCFGGPSTLDHPTDLCLTDAGEIVVASRNRNEIVVFAADGSAVVKRFGSDGLVDGQFREPTALAFVRGKLFVLDGWSPRVQVFG